VEHALASRLGEVVVVIGNEAERIRAEIDTYGVRAVLNPHFAEGQSTSLKAGMSEISADAEAVIVLMADQPFVSSEIIDALIERYVQKDCPIVAPEYNGQVGSPVLFDRRYFSDLRLVTGDKGGRDIIRAQAERVCRLKIDTTLAANDIDTWQEYEQLIASASQLEE
jgi:molybdenum cofactor cytidylyltransferase